MSGNRSKRKKPKTAARKLSGTAPSKSSKPTASAHWQQTGGHIYRYHPPRADHPLLQSARQAVEVASLPKSVDLRQLCTPIRAQGKEESCTGFAAAAFRETSYVAKTGVLLPYYLAPAYLYGWTRINDGTFPKDSGASLAGEFAVLQQRGVCPESYLPFLFFLRISALICGCSVFVSFRVHSWFPLCVLASLREIFVLWSIRIRQKGRRRRGYSHP
jgi:hypothetical protein